MASIKEKELTTKNGKKIIIRTAKIKDASQLCRFMFNISSERIYSLAEPEDFSETVNTNTNRIRKFKASEGKLYIVAEHKKKIFGLVQFDNYRFKKSMHNGFFAVYISKPWREKGIGRLLIGELLGWAKSNPLIEKVSLNVFSNNPRAIALYRKMGFKQEGLCKRDMKFNGEYVDSVLMYRFVD